MSVLSAALSNGIPPAIPVVATTEAVQTPTPGLPPSPSEITDLQGIVTQTTPADAEARAGEIQGHDMQIPGGGPKLNIRGFFDFNFGTGSVANPLIFPVAMNGCMICGNPKAPTPTGFQAGEFDLLMTSKLSDHLSFLSELVFGANTTNEFGIDIERYELTYRLNDYFSASAGRFHTAIGYYNTAFHHGNWFSTAEGRPIMYLFEDSGGVLPVHTVGVSMSGLVPKTGGLGLHWIAELGNGRASNAGVKPVQNFYSDRSYKALNLAAYIQPVWLDGLQIGGSYYHDRLAPSGPGHIDQHISSLYVVYNSATWEFLNEAVLLSNHIVSMPFTFRSPMGYTQLSRKFNIYHPYFRYQYVNDRVGDPVNILQGLFYGPSAGIRVDFSNYAALKLQYNRLLKGTLPAANGFNAQIAFTF